MAGKYLAFKPGLSPIYYIILSAFTTGNCGVGISGTYFQIQSHGAYDCGYEVDNDGEHRPVLYKRGTIENLNSECQASR